MQGGPEAAPVANATCDAVFLESRLKCPLSSTPHGGPGMRRRCIAGRIAHDADEAVHALLIAAARVGRRGGGGTSWIRCSEAGLSMVAHAALSG